MTLHFTLTYLWVLLGIVWFVPAWLGFRMTFEIGEWAWWQRVLWLLWPLGLIYTIVLRVLWWLCPHHRIPPPTSCR